MRTLPPTSPITPQRVLHDDDIEHYYPADGMSPTEDLITAGRIGLELIDELKSKNNLIEHLSNRLRHIYTASSSGTPDHFASTSSVSDITSSVLEQSMVERAEKEIGRLDVIVEAQRREIEQLLAGRAKLEQMYVEDTQKLTREINEQNLMISALREQSSRPETVNRSAQVDLQRGEIEQLNRQLIEQNMLFQKQMKKITNNQDTQTPLVIPGKEDHSTSTCDLIKPHTLGTQTEHGCETLVMRGTQTHQRTPSVYARTDCVQIEHQHVVPFSPYVDDSSTQLSMVENQPPCLTPPTRRIDRDGDVLMMTVRQDHYVKSTGKILKGKVYQDMVQTENVVILSESKNIHIDALNCIREKTLLASAISERLNQLFVSAGGA
jgi:hypothetical protein